MPTRLVILSPATPSFSFVLRQAYVTLLSGLLPARSWAALVDFCAACTTLSVSFFSFDSFFCSDVRRFYVLSPFLDVRGRSVNGGWCYHEACCARSRGCIRRCESFENKRGSTGFWSEGHVCLLRCAGRQLTEPCASLTSLCLTLRDKLHSRTVARLGLGVNRPLAEDSLR